MHEIYNSKIMNSMYVMNDEQCCRCILRVRLISKELLKIYVYAYVHDKDWKPLVVFVKSTGCRRKEA